MDKIGVGLVGCGVMGTALAASCNKLEHAHILAVSDVRQDIADKAAAELNARAFTDNHDMLALSDIDAVLVAVPGFLHRAPAVSAAQAGKHVFCEKPMAVSLEDCDAIMVACDEADRKLMIGQVCRFHGVHGRVKQLVLDGHIGQPTCMVVRRLGGGWTTLSSRLRGAAPPRGLHIAEAAIRTVTRMLTRCIVRGIGGWG